MYSIQLAPFQSEVIFSAVLQCITIIIDVKQHQRSHYMSVYAL